MAKAFSTFTDNEGNPVAVKPSLVTSISAYAPEYGSDCKTKIVVGEGPMAQVIYVKEETSLVISTLTADA